MTASAKGRDLFIVDNSVSGWTGLRYLEEWTGIAKAFDIATGYFEIGALLALDGKWQALDKIRILMGAEMTHRTRKALLDAVRGRAGRGQAGTALLDGTERRLRTCRPITAPNWRTSRASFNSSPKDVVSALDRGTVFPLFLENESSQEQSLIKGDKLTTNLSTAFLRRLNERFQQGTSARIVPTGLAPEDIFHYAYAVFHSPRYRGRYAEFLKIDFPRLPLTGDLALFRDLARLGGELVALHLLESPKLDNFPTTYSGPKNPEVSRVSWSNGTVWLDAAATKKGQPATPGSMGFLGVPEAVWNFHIGGYQVCEKWLKDRKGRTLSKDDIAHYQKIVVALSETIRLMKEIDAVIEQHGGWPGAFASGAAPESAVTSKDEGSSDNVIPIRGVSAQQSELYDQMATPLLKVAEPRAPAYVQNPRALAGHGSNAAPEDLGREELVCRVRQVFSDGVARPREAAIGELARELGYQRTGTRIHKTLDDILRTAVRRGVLDNVAGSLQIGVKSIEHYQREFLEDQFLAALDGVTWTERDDAIRALARWLGFRRTGPTIDDTARSLINGLIREARLEDEGTRVRRVR